MYAWSNLAPGALGYITLTLIMFDLLLVSHPPRGAAGRWTTVCARGAHMDASGRPPEIHSQKSNVAASRHRRVSRPARTRRFRRTRMDRRVRGPPGALPGAGGGVGVSGYASSVVVRSRILRFRAWHPGAVGSACASGDERPIPRFPQPDVRWRRHDSRRLVHALALARS